MIGKIQGNVSFSGLTVRDKVVPNKLSGRNWREYGIGFNKATSVEMFKKGLFNGYSRFDKMCDTINELSGADDVVLTVGYKRREVTDSEIPHYRFYNTFDLYDKTNKTQIASEEIRQNGNDSNACRFLDSLVQRYRDYKDQVLNADSPQLQNGQVHYMTEPSEAKAYWFDYCGGNEAEILKNNPGVYKGADGKYYVPSKQNPESPHLINSPFENIIIMHDGTEDMEVCSRFKFEEAYIDTASFKADGSFVHPSGSSLPFGQIIDVTKCNSGSFTFVPEGTKVRTYEGVQTVGKGQVVTFDYLGYPCLTSASDIKENNFPMPGHEANFEKMMALALQ